jgi:hypothetical protein
MAIRFPPRTPISQWRIILTLLRQIRKPKAHAFLLVIRSYQAFPVASVVSCTTDAQAARVAQAAP